MSHHVCMGAQLKCMMGSTPSKLLVLPPDSMKMTMTSNKPAANIMDHKPVVNILPFGPCKSPMFPATAAATAAALGTLTPMPCIPLTISPWTPGSPTVLLGNQPSLNKSSKLMCSWGGMIEIVDEGQATHDIP